MALNKEMKQLLSGFEKRMKFINIVRCLLDYKYPENIKSMILEKKILDNMIVAVLVYIKDRTLSTQQTCNLTNIEIFLENLSVVLPMEYEINCKALARYIIVDVLQNGGVLTEFLTFDSTSESFVLKEIRLINEKNRNYYLTNDALDFIYRSKEIESELDYSVTRFRMQEYMKRDNYSEALEASRELVSRIRNMKVSMDDFLLRCRENVSRITIDQYDEIVQRIHNLLDSEYKELSEIQKSADNRMSNLIDAKNSGIGIEEIKNNHNALSEIVKNITQTIEEQRGLINKKTSLSEAYDIILRENFSVNRLERMNFEKDIMIPLRRSNDKLGDAANFFLFMLTTPQFAKQFSVENFYAPQTSINEIKGDDGIDVCDDNNPNNHMYEIRNKRFLRITELFFAYANEHDCFYASDFVKSMSISDLLNFSEENALPHVLLSLLSMMELNIEKWNESEKFVIVPDGEFELSWCLGEITKEYLQIKKIVFSANKSVYSFELNEENNAKKIDFTDFMVEVLR